MENFFHAVIFYASKNKSNFNGPWAMAVFILFFFENLAAAGHGWISLVHFHVGKSNFSSERNIIFHVIRRRLN
jgi:hypothetical protein